MQDEPSSKTKAVAGHRISVLTQQTSIPLSDEPLSGPRPSKHDQGMHQRRVAIRYRLCLPYTAEAPTHCVSRADLHDMVRIRELRSSHSSDEPYHPPPHHKATNPRHITPFLHHHYKNRLYILILRHDDSRTYHWGLAIGPKNDVPDPNGARPEGHVYHATQDYAVPRPNYSMREGDEWHFQPKTIVSGHPGRNGVARILIGKNDTPSN